MLKMAHSVKETINYAKSLVTSHNTAILEQVREMPNLLSRPSAILENVCQISISPILRVIYVLSVPVNESIHRIDIRLGY